MSNLIAAPLIEDIVENIPYNASCALWPILFNLTSWHEWNTIFNPQIMCNNENEEDATGIKVGTVLNMESKFLPWLPFTYTEEIVSVISSPSVKEQQQKQEDVYKICWDLKSVGIPGGIFGPLFWLPFPPISTNRCLELIVDTTLSNATTTTTLKNYIGFSGVLGVIIYFVTKSIIEDGFSRFNQAFLNEAERWVEDGVDYCFKKEENSG